jgi:hypothetical protein
MGIAVADIYRYGLWGQKKTERGVQASKQALVRCRVRLPVLCLFLFLSLFFCRASLDHNNNNKY